MGLPVRIAFVHDLLLMSAITAAGAFTMHRGFALSSALFLLGSIVVGAVPDRLASGMFSGFSIAAVLVSVVMFRAWRRDLASGGRE